jgi:hypothetical protein
MAPRLLLYRDFPSYSPSRLECPITRRSMANVLSLILLSCRTVLLVVLQGTEHEAAYAAPRALQALPVLHQRLCQLLPCSAVSAMVYFNRLWAPADTACMAHLADAGLCQYLPSTAGTEYGLHLQRLQPVSFSRPAFAVPEILRKACIPPGSASACHGCCCCCPSVSCWQAYTSSTSCTTSCCSRCKSNLLSLWVWLRWAGSPHPACCWHLAGAELCHSTTDCPVQDTGCHLLLSACHAA